MCGRYVLRSRPAAVRKELEKVNSSIHVQSVPNDEDVRQSYNFAPGNFGITIRSSPASSPSLCGSKNPEEGKQEEVDCQVPSFSCQLDAMKWGLIPSWKKSVDDPNFRQPINCRDDSLAGDSPMWASIKKSKRCVVVADGFYEWIKCQNNVKLPYYIKRKDGKLMYFAGLWDCVYLKGSDSALFTYTIVTTESNEQLKFLHERMPVMLDPDSTDITSWLDVSKPGWTAELQSLCRPYYNTNALDVHRVGREVGNVNNDSASLTVPIDSPHNKHSITSFFAKQADSKPKTSAEPKQQDSGTDDPFNHEVKAEDPETPVRAENVQFPAASPPLKRSWEEETSSSTTEQPPLSASTPTKRAKPNNKPTARGSTKSPSKSPGSNMKITSFFSGS